MADQPSSHFQPHLLLSQAEPSTKLQSDNADESSSTISKSSSVSPSLSSASSSTSSFSFAETSSVSSRTFETRSSESAADDKGYLPILQSNASTGLLPEVRSGLTSRGAAEQRRMGHVHQSSRTPRSGQTGVEAQRRDLPRTIRLLDGEERGLPSARFEEYTNFRLQTVIMSNTIQAPPNRTVDYNICENYFAPGHRCLGDSFKACRMQPPYRTQAGSDLVPPKGSSDSTSFSKSSRIKEVVESLVGFVTTAKSRPSARQLKTTKCKGRSSGCSNDLCSEGSEGKNRAKSKTTRESPVRLCEFLAGNVAVSQSFSQGPPTYDTVMKDQKPVAAEDSSKRS
ncbi:hypothetical protein RvY_03831 [Ramazzottius varieornatus]|uniref:Uncharacterized protein n=1 Tax=Ramazzottius varieornatus TaxID=947166 RepID=A0A1D1UPF2_RAMVA|nr:hypothetical protein RvY_03831 [Ramazzottius varieornatus]